MYAIRSYYVEEIFDDMAAHIDVFKDLNYDNIGRSGVKLKTRDVEETVKT